MKRKLHTTIVICLSLCCSLTVLAQQGAVIRGKIRSADGKAAEDISVQLPAKKQGTRSSSSGEYKLEHLAPGVYTIRVSAIGLSPIQQTVTLKDKEIIRLDFTLTESLAQLQEVNVNAGKRNRFVVRKNESAAKMPLNYLENPQAYTTITKELLTEQLITSLGDGLRNTPGLVKIGSTSGRSNDGGAYYTLRGFATQISMVDGIASRTNADFDPANVEKIEVIRGPSGALYGGALTTFGGLINLVTKKPLDTAGGEISYSHGAYRLNRVSADVYGPADKNKRLLFRLNTAWQQQHTFQDAGIRKSFFAAPTADYHFSKNLKLNVGAEFYQYEATSPTVIFLNRVRQFIAHTPQELHYDWNRSYTSNDMRMKTPSVNLHAELNYKINAQWSAKTYLTRNTRKSDGFYQYEFIRGATSDALLERSIQLQDAFAASTNFQQNVTGDFKIGNLRNRLVAGIDYLNQTAKVNNSPIVVFDNVSGLKDTMSPEYGSLNRASAEQKIAGSTAARTHTYTASDVYSVYASDILNVTDNLLAMISLRADRFQSLGTINKNTGALLANSKYGQTALSPKFGLVYHIIKDQVAVFGNYMNSFSNVAPVTQPEGYSGNFKPQQANQWEGGLKLDLFQHRLSLTASYYDIKVSNTLRTEPVTVNGASTTLTVQNGTQLSKGVEIELIANPLEGLNVIAGYGYNDSRYTRISTVLEGRRPAAAGPSRLGNAWISYTMPQGTLKGAGLGFGGNFVGKQVTADSQVTGVFTFPSYTLLNVTAFYSARRYRLGFKLDNLTDRLYFSGQGVMAAQLPRNYTANLTVKF